MDNLIIQRLLDELKNGSDVALSIITKACGSSPRGEGTMMGVLKDGNLFGTIGGGKLEKLIIDKSMECLETQLSNKFTLNLTELEDGIGMACGGQVEVYIKVFHALKKLIIIGGGHIAVPLNTLGKILNFTTVIFEDRVEYCNKERFPNADELIVGSLSDNLDGYIIDNNSYVVIITRGHQYDEIALRSVINKNPKYIGVIGSKAKTSKLIKALRDDNIDEEIINNIYSPIGLNFGGETPEEIAFSIIGQILLIKNNGTLHHLKDIK